ncbi:MAG TPA: ABC transporter ATP-binding protein [Gemmatimonadales bacterium]|nr:ABC transporter ATP-binding protein [Gemmatimonadales bacterium]
MTTGSSGTPAVVAEELSKHFGPTVAVDKVSLTVGTGELFGLIGSDGSGKTTLFRMLTTLMVPTSGTAAVLGRDVVKELWALRQRVGYMAGRFSLYPDLSVEENLRFFASVFGTTIEREMAQIEPIYTQIEPFKSRRASALSGGMKQKLALCCALVHRPEILFLDEPTTGVDAVSRREFWDLLGTLKASGLTIVVSTPYMDEAVRCDRVALMQHGRIMAVDTPAAVTRSFDRPMFTVRAVDRHRLLKLVRQYPGTHSAYPFGEVLHYTDRKVEGPAAPVGQALAAWLGGQGLAGVEVLEAEPTIEDVFIARMGAPEAPPETGGSHAA